VRVIHVINSIAPTRGGPTNVVLGLSRALAAGGVEVEVVSTRADLDARGEDAARHGLGDVRLTLVDVAGPARIELAPALLPALVARLRGADVVHVHTVFTYPVAVTPLVCRMLRVPYVIRPAGTLDAVSIASRSTRRKRLALALVCRQNLLRAAAVQATSAHEQRELSALVPQARTCVLEIGVDVDALGQVAADRGCPGRRIGFLGRLHPKKGVEHLIDALARLPHAELEIAGSGETGYEASLRAHAQRLGVAARIRFSGHVNERQKLALLERMDVLAFPSSDENFGLAVAEAMAAGRAVVVSPGVALETDIRAANAGAVCAAEGGELARTIGSLLTEGSRRAALAAAGQRLARDRWRWSRIAAQTSALYERLTTRPRTG
jgi:glycosyltransferase involved in cell wall biosynthesis